MIHKVKSEGSIRGFTFTNSNEQRYLRYLENLLSHNQGMVVLETSYAINVGLEKFKF